MSRRRDVGKTTAESNLLVGRYRLGPLLGDGAMSTVHLARDEQLGREVAVKIFPTRSKEQKDIVAQKAEMTLLARLNHHGIVTLLDAGVELGNPEQPRAYLVMEVVLGTDLQKRLDLGELSARQVALIGCDLAEGLEYLHQFQIVHRDVKPANILLTEDAADPSRIHAKLGDFGIAVPMDRLGNTTGVTQGTAAYLSPEQVLGEPLGPASDVYSLGLVLLECFTRELAFTGEPKEAAMARLESDPIIPEGISPEWHELLTAMTARESSARPSTREIVLALRQSTAVELGKHRAVFDPTDEERELSRMREVSRYEILDTPADGAFDRITALAARFLVVPMAIVSIVDHDRIWFKSHHGLEIQQVPRDPGLCASAILDDKPWVVEDARNDPRALANPLVAGEFGLQFYAGVSLRTREGHNLGTLCVLDRKTRVLAPDELTTLKELAEMVVHELELRLKSRHAQKQFEKAREAEGALVR